MGSRITWPQLQQSDDFKGRWVALDDCRYDARTAQPIEGSVVDADEISRSYAAGSSRGTTVTARSCSATDLPEMPPASSRRPSLAAPPPSNRALTH